MADVINIIVYNIFPDNTKFWRVFESTGTEWLPPEIGSELVHLLGKFVCLRFGSDRINSIDAIRFKKNDKV